MSHLCYQLRIEPVYDNQVYRVLEIDSNCTFGTV